MESIEASTDALSSVSVISFMMGVVEAGQKLAMWAAPAVLALAEHFDKAWASFLELDQRHRTALVVAGALEPPVLRDHPALSPFDNLVGRLMAMARNQWGKRIPDGQYQLIAAAIDQQGWKPLRHLEKNYQKDLATWNQRSGRPIHSFEQALAPKSKFRRAVLRRFYRAHDKYRKMNPPLSG